MFHGLDSFRVDHLLKLPQVEHHAGHRIRLAFERHLDHIVVAVAVRVRVRAVYGKVLLRAERGVGAHVGGGKLGLAGKQHRSSVDYFLMPPRIAPMQRSCAFPVPAERSHSLHQSPHFQHLVK